MKNYVPIWEHWAQMGVRGVGIMRIEKKKATVETHIRRFKEGLFLLFDLVTINNEIVVSLH